MAFPVPAQCKDFPMLFPCTSQEDWTTRYGVEPFEATCRSCGKVIEVNIPIAFDSWRGLSSDIHEPCGEKYRVYRSISLDSKWQALLNSVVDTL